jgi:hypothetical protein
MTPSAKARKQRELSKHLSSKILMLHFENLVTRTQTTTSLKGGGGGDEIAEQVEILRSIRLPEENEHRLALATEVLAAALRMVEFEASLDARDDTEAKLDDGALGKATPPTGGYS